MKDIHIDYIMYNEAWPARRSSEARTRSVRGAGCLPGSLRSLWITLWIELYIGIYLPVEGWADARIR